MITLEFKPNIHLNDKITIKIKKKRPTKKKRRLLILTKKCKKKTLTKKFKCNLHFGMIKKFFFDKEIRFSIKKER
jgi:hypothetical protein